MKLTQNSVLSGRIRARRRPPALERKRASSQVRLSRRRSMVAPNVGEEWRPISGFGGRYEVSDHGRVRSCGPQGRAQAQIVLKPSLNGIGYPRLSLRCGSKRHNRTVHSLVLLAFVGPRPTGLHACHIDGNPENNHISNLMWGSQEENERHKKLHGTAATGDRNGARRHPEKLIRGFAHANATKPDSVVRGLVQDRTSGMTYAQLAAKYGIHARTAWRWVQGKVRKEAMTTGGSNANQ